MFKELLLAGLVISKCGGAYKEPIREVPPPPPPVVIQEDDPAWDCETMGNMRCGEIDTDLSRLICDEPGFPRLILDFSNETQWCEPR